MTDREYILVEYDDKQDAKSLGANFDYNKRLWYIPENINEINKLKLQEKFKPYVSLIYRLLSQ